MKKPSSLILMLILTVTVFGSRAASGSQANAHLQTPAAPRADYEPVAELARPDDVTDYFRGVVVDGDYAYALGWEGTLLTYDISPLSGDAFTTLDKPVDATTLESGFGVLQQGDTLYVYGLNGVQPVDVSDPAAPVAGTATNDAWIVNARLQDGYLVGAADDAVVVYSLDAAGPTLVETAALTDGERAFSLSIFDGAIIVRHTGAGSDPAGYSIIEYTSLDSLGAPTRIDDAALAYHQHLFDDRLVACTDYVLELWDVSTPTSPSLLTSTSLPDFGDGRICIRDGDRIITNGSVHSVGDDGFEEVGLFEPTYGQSDGYPYHGALDDQFIFVTQNVRVLLISRPGQEGAQCFVAEADTYAWDNFGSNRDSNYGDAATVDVASLGDVDLDRRTAYLRFDLGAIPTRAAILSADLDLYLVDVEGDGSQLDVTLKAVEEAWAEMTLTWNNQPGRSAADYDVQTVTDDAGWKTWDASALVDEWVAGQRSNDGLALVTGGVGAAPAHFHSREGSAALAPQLCVEWADPEFATLVVGAPSESVALGDDEFDQAGAINALYSSGGPLSAAGDEIWHQGTPGVAGALEADDNFGRALAAGDFNGDGYPDVAIGAPYEDVEEDEGILYNAGAVNVLYGALSGLSASGSQIWHGNSPGTSWTAEAQENFGYAVAAGDFNGDGYDDLAIGIPGQSYYGSDDAGAVAILYGSADGLTAADSEEWSQTWLVGAAEEDDRFGHSLATGDFNGDGYADLAVGVPREDVGQETDAGAVNVIPGSATGLTGVGDQLWHQDSANVADQAEANDYFGWSLAAADFTGNGFDDLAVGVRQETIEDAAAYQAGAVNVLFGSVAGLTGSGGIWHQDSPGIAGRAESNDYFGQALAAGDFNGDGYADLAVGAHWEGVEPLSDNGAVNVLYSSSFCGFSTGNDQIWHQDTEGVPGEAENGDHFGHALAAGDLDGDGYDDLAVGAPGESVGDLSGAGAANLFYGSATGLTAEGSQIWHQDSAGVNGVAEAGDRFGSALAILTPPPSVEPPAPASDILDLDAVGWRSGRHHTSSEFGERFVDLRAQGYMIVDIETDEVDGEQQVADVWQRNVDGRAWRERRDMSRSSFEEWQAYYEQNGYRMIDQEVYVLGSSVNYAGIWIENTEELAWDHYYDVTSSEFGDLFDTYDAMGYMPIDIDAYVVDGDLFFSAIWVDNVDDLVWHEWRNMSSAGFAERFDQYHSRFRMTDVESYHHNDTQYYAGIWVENRNGREWFERRDMSSKGFGETWSALRDAGYRLVDYELYPTADGWKHAGVWRQNGNRPDWPLRCAVDAILEEGMEEYGIPGMSVAIARDGRWSYLRGFGYADVDDSVDADSRTVYSLASISKSVGGVLALRLVEDEAVDFDINAPTRQYVPELPTHHTHIFSQTLSHWAGFGHYPDYRPDHYEWFDEDYNPDADDDDDGPDDNYEPDHFDTATAAARRMWDAPLPYAPPGSQYQYSSFGPTFAGAAMEGVAGASIPALIRDYLQIPFNLTTLRPYLSVPDPKRSLVYHAGTRNEAPPADWSYVLLGGGLEASAYDLARLGIGLTNGSILTDIMPLWTPVDPRANYGLGWRIRWTDGTMAVTHGGVHHGAGGYIHIYPAEDIVIVLLSNRRHSENEIKKMGRAIGSLMINDFNAAASRPLLHPADHEEIDEPDAEALPAEYVVWPQSDPVGEIEDYSDPIPEEDFWPPPLLYLPLISD